MVMALAITTLILSCYLAARLMFIYPLPWPDEALFADVAARFARTGVLGTDLYHEAIPSLTRHFFMTPPLYLLLVAAVFRVTGPGLLPLRLLSVGIACILAALTYGVARRSGLGRIASLGVVAILPGNIVFFRCALTGRMDGMSLAFVMLALWLALGEARRQGVPHPGPARGTGFAMGCTAGLAFLSHPLGAVALPIALVVPAAAPRPGGPAAADGGVPRTLAHAGWADLAWPALLGFTVCVLPWGLYTLRDIPGFALQVGNQVNGRSFGPGLALFLSQWVAPWPFVAVTVLAGFGGLLRLGRDVGSVRGLWVAQLLLLLAAVVGSEGWYAVYVLPLTAIGLVRMTAYVDAPRAWPALGGASCATLAGLLALSGIMPLAILASPRHQAKAGIREYHSWCQEIERTIPAGTTMLLNCIPALNFGLSPGRNALRFMRPRGYVLKPAEGLSALNAVDYVVASREITDPELAAWVRANRKSMVKIGTGDYSVYVIRMH
jgi:hypothetical protein